MTTVSHIHNHTSCEDICSADFCRLKCSLEVVDELLSTPGAVSRDDTDLLLDLRSLLRSREDGEKTLRLFCELRRRLEHKHYLAFHRLRRWLENHLAASVRLCPAAEPHLVSVKLDRYCVEAIRRVCLCSGLGKGSVLLAPRVQFTFRSIDKSIAQPSSQLAIAG